jgi:hypothetical protein
MDAKLRIYEGCESAEPIKVFTCKRLTFNVGTKIEILADKVAKLEKSKKGASAEELAKINDEQLELTIETIQAIFPSFTREDFNGLDPLEYQEFINEIGKATNQAINRAAKN